MRDIYIFLIIPIINCIYFFRNVDKVDDLITLLAYIAVNFLMSTFFYVAVRMFDSFKGFRIKQIGVCIFFLICIDQGIKGIIYYWKIGGIIWNNILGIKPVMNKEQMAILNFLKIELPDTVIIMFKIMIIIAMLFVFFNLRKKNRNRIAVFIFLFAAGIATLLDSLFWAYTLDYILFVGVTCYDLKDFYVNTALGFLLLEQIRWINADL